MGRDENINSLQSISEKAKHPMLKEVWEMLYPKNLATNTQERIDLLIAQVIECFQSSVDQSTRAITEKDEIIKAKDKAIEHIINDKELTIKDKERIINDKELTIKDKERIINDKQLAVKDKEDMVQMLTEAADVAKALKDFATKPVQKWGTVTRSQAWNLLSDDGNVQVQHEVKNESHERRDDLLRKLKLVDPSSWQEEIEMYPGIMGAIRKGLYEGDDTIFVVDTHSKGAIRVDISVAHSEDSRLPYCLRFFLELKLPKGNLATAENCGQILDYFNALHGYQPYRTEFVGILSNFKESLVFTANYSGDKVTVAQRWAETLADAVIFADRTSKKQYQTKIPVLNDRLGSQYNILTCSRLHFLLSVPNPTPSAQGKENTALTHAHNTRSKFKTNSLGDDPWTVPSRHTGRKDFVLKIAHREDTTVANEIAVLKKLREADCQHLPELVWSPLGDRELGILPLGSPINFREPQAISRIIVQHLMDGLKFLHDLGIVHRDLRPSNLIVEYSADNKVNVVIIDFENALLLKDVPKLGVDYLGGYISWPMRHLLSCETLYSPKVEDDLLASILLVLHLLFPAKFNAFHASRIQHTLSGLSNSTVETVNLIKLWEDIRYSPVWGPFLEAAEQKNYEKLKGMADVFCHI